MSIQDCVRRQQLYAAVYILGTLLLVGRASRISTIEAEQSGALHCCKVIACSHEVLLKAATLLVRMHFIGACKKHSCCRQLGHDSIKGVMLKGRTVKWNMLSAR